MKRVDYDILSLFKGNPSVELSTTDLVSSLYPEEYSSANEVFSDEFASKTSTVEAKEQIAKLHRRVLHHVSSLVKDGSLVVSRIEGKGKKFYTLALQEGEELIIDKYKKKLIITKPSKPVLPLNDLQEKEIVHLVETESFFERVNAILLTNYNRFDSLDALQEYVTSLFSQVNDVIGMNDFEYLLTHFSVEEMISFIKQLHDDAVSYNRRVSCIIDFTNITSYKDVMQFFEQIFQSPLTHIHFVFDTTSRELLEYNDLIEKLIELYADAKLKFNIKNDDLCHAPYFLGKSGPYTIQLKDWKHFISSHYKDSIGLVCTQSSITYDIAEAKKFNSSAKFLSEGLQQVSRALFFSNVYQRRYSADMHKKVMGPFSSVLTPIFSHSTNVIRLWNYEIDDASLLLESLDQCKKDIDEFTKRQEIIYLSCGMPTRFKIELSIAYRSSTLDEPLKPKFEKLFVKGLKDFYNTDFKQKMLYYEKAAKLFSGGFEVRFNRIGVIECLDVLQEISFVMNSYNVPFFCYYFSNRVGANQKLDAYMN